MLFANAGHSAVIFRPVNGRPLLLDADRIPLGIQEKSLSKNHRLCLAEGDLFVVTTDGFYEARNPRGKSFGIHRLLKQMQRLNGQSAIEISDGLLRTINKNEIIFASSSFYISTDPEYNCFHGEINGFCNFFS